MGKKIICNRKDCTGCSICSAICPKKCIDLVENDEHYLYPVIDNKKCINCNMCRKVCPVLNKNENETILGYSAQLKDEKILNLCASGGAFAGIAMTILDNGGIVYGVGCNENNKLSFQRIDKKENLSKILNSKYYQCYITNNIVDSIINDLKTKIVLFSGTPCQVSAIKNIKNINHQNLYTFEILCQGVHNHFVVDKYNKFLEKKEKSKIVSHVFRSKKKYVGRNYLNEYKFKNGKIKYFIGEEDPLSLSFQYQIFLRNSCYNCNYTNNKRVADFTGGDIWNEKFCSSDMDFKKGVSILLCNSIKACKLISSQNYFNLKNINYEDALKNNIPYHHSVTKPFTRFISFRLLNLNINPYIVTKICCVKYYIKKLIRGVK